MDKEQLTIAIVEDQQDNIDILSFYFDQYKDQYNIKYIAKSGHEARHVLTNQDIDLALLDIDLGDETVFDVLDQIDNHHLNQSLIFVTAHGTFENALKAIKYSCLNFITKPIDFDELENTLNQVISQRASENSDQINILLDILRNDQQSPKKIGIILPKGILEFIECSDITYIGAESTLTNIYLNNGNKLRSIKTLGYYNKLLDQHPDFIQIHKSSLININSIQKFDARKRLLTMINKDVLEVSKRQLPHFQNYLQKKHNSV